ncbi:SDR family NAD(P)-dependent oxidoreductase [Ktedonosporobacter rubrisoli]|uniref:SDR family NAD(P)-dependent oxidoreductase n=1 Tax=Ktedonosporobacter rubrisoli TaxID=2509675 RepID=A0A4P6K478_KTERU|nr:SDR family oxidoreductase [Ktedonosporobacter rubrisoli]QBD83019.1 SDR family NAD(P)-dependent oxidoreductase [Ktedonosporobacter rubrisoli]
MPNHHTLFDVQGQVAVITGGSGVLGRTMALGLAQAGVKVVVIGRHAETAAKVAEEIGAAGGEAIGIACDVTARAALERALEQSIAAFGSIDILVNAAGGNLPQAVTSPERSFFDLTEQAIDEAIRLNFTGTLQACQVFGRGMAERGKGCIVNVASMASLRPLTRTVAYNAAKAAIGNFTQWLAVHMAQEYGSHIRVNAMAPGFFLTEQNRALLTNVEAGTLTPRGQTIIDHTPMRRLGAPEDLVGTLLWLVSPASAFVTGIMIPVDGGFSAFSGV